MIRRFDDWQTRLDVCLADAARTGFVWGENDCCMSAANAVRACTGVDPASAYRGTYSTAQGAVSRLRRAGGDPHRLIENMAAGIAADLGLEEIDPVYAQALDVAFLPFENAAALDGVLSVCDGLTFVAFTPDGGLARSSFLYAARLPGARAWRV